VKQIYLIGFRGTGLRLGQFKNEPLLIRVGHVGFYFEGDENRVFGFHPTVEAAQAIGDESAIIDWLKKLNPIPGTIHDDTDLFRRADELTEMGARTQVWEMPIEVTDDDFERKRDLTLLWYTQQKVFLYSFPSEELIADRDNCATFPRRLGLRLPEETGQLIAYVPKLAQHGTRWRPKEDNDDRSSE